MRGSVQTSEAHRFDLLAMVLASLGLASSARSLGAGWSRGTRAGAGSRSGTACATEQFTQLLIVGMWDRRPVAQLVGAVADEDISRGRVGITHEIRVQQQSAMQIAIRV